MEPKGGKEVAELVAQVLATIVAADPELKVQIPGLECQCLYGLKRSPKPVTARLQDDRHDRPVMANNNPIRIMTTRW